MTTDPTREVGRWDALFILLKQIDGEIEEFYVRQGVDGVRARFVRPMIRLAHEGPMTVSELAKSLGGTHSATSQTISALKSSGFVSSTPGTDGRTQVLSLTDRAERLIPLLEAEWRATDAVVAQLDDELDGAVTALSRALEHRLTLRTMSQRLDDEMGQQA